MEISAVGQVHVNSFSKLCFLKTRLYDQVLLCFFLLDDKDVLEIWQYEHGKHLSKLLEASGGTVEFISKTPLSKQLGLW